MESGDFFIPAMIGFILTAVFMPFLAVMSVSLSNNGLLAIGQRVHPVFGLIFTIVIYLSIGALYGIPRASSVAYELGFVQAFQVDNRLSLFLFTVVFFGLTYILSINPKKMINRIGQILTPALLVVLAVLFVKAFTTLNYTGKPTAEKFQSSPFLAGFLEGYYTMDAIAALAFGIVIINGLKLTGVGKKKRFNSWNCSCGNNCSCRSYHCISFTWLDWKGTTNGYTCRKWRRNTCISF